MDKKQKSIDLKKSSSSFHQTEKELLERTKEKKELIDGLLDIYNDYRILYSLFKDAEYEQVMKLTLRKLKLLSNRSDKDNGTKNLE